MNPHAIREVVLELLRSGPAHNQLLSPLTPYVALCGSAGPVTVHLPFEHRQLLTRLERLRYGSGDTAIAASQREAELREIGEAVGRLWGQVPALLTELGNAAEQQARLVNLRLSITAHELGLVPFEAAIGPEGIASSGSPLLLRSLISLTREVRRGQPLTVDWNRPPRILYAFATPQGLPEVPAEAHLRALRLAIAPWVPVKDAPAGRVAGVKALLTVLPDASLKQIRAACRATEYTHVHILAHGAPFSEAGSQRYGVALCGDADPAASNVVDGERLAIALKGWDASGRARRPPTVVTLACCDSGRIDSVLVPGASIAHELHADGIPWVIASQFPLWMRASSIAAEVLYAGLLGGSDPRWVLHELRQRLRTDVPDTHDWAAVVAYATIAPDLERQVDAFRDRQVRAAMEVRFGRIDDLVGANAADGAGRAAGDAGAEHEVRALCEAIRADLQLWCGEPAALADPALRAERLGMRGAGEKRMAIAYDILGRPALSTPAYERARDHYRAALEADPTNHWVITQYLSLLALPQLADDAGSALADRYGSWWAAARQIAAWQLLRAEGTARGWALGTLAELELLAAVYAVGGSSDGGHRAGEVVRLCTEMRALLPADSAPVCSTLRQFRRYLRHWHRDGWDAAARGAVAALSGG